MAPEVVARRTDSHTACDAASELCNEYLSGQSILNPTEGKIP